LQFFHDLHFSAAKIGPFRTRGDYNKCAAAQKRFIFGKKLNQNKIIQQNYALQHTFNEKDDKLIVKYNNTILFEMLFTI
jgi:hypothetical protein